MSLIPHIADTSVAARAKSAVRSSGLTQRDIARRINIDETKLSKSLAGTRAFTVQELNQLAKLTGVTVDWLVDTDEPAPMTPSRNQEHREKTLDAAWRLFAEYGFDAVRISDIAGHAGLSTATVLYYFSTKSELFVASLEHAVKAFTLRKDEILNNPVANPTQKLLTIVVEQLPHDDASWSYWSLWSQFWASAPVSAPSKAAHAKAYDSWRGVVANIITDGQATGEFQNSDTDLLVDTITALLDGLGIRILSELIEPDQAKQVINHFIESSVMADTEANIDVDTMALPKLQTFSDVTSTEEEKI